MGRQGNCAESAGDLVYVPGLEAAERGPFDGIHDSPQSAKVPRAAA